VSIDTEKRERALDERYALDSPEGVRLLLSEYHALEERQYMGDYDAVVILADLRIALERADLTERQRQAVHYVYFEDRTQSETAKMLGVRQDTISVNLERAETRIARIYENWALKDEGYSLHAPFDYEEEITEEDE